MLLKQPENEPKTCGGQPGNQNASGHGAPLGNANRFSTGLRGALTLGSVPKPYSYIRKIAGRFRREVETAALDAHGTLGLFHLALAQSATRHEMRVLYAMRALRDGSDTLPLADRLRLMDVIGSATDSRDRCLKSLGLDQTRHADPWSVIDNPPAVGARDVPGRDGGTSTTQIVESATDATGAASCGPTWQPTPDGLHETNTSGHATSNGDAQA